MQLVLEEIAFSKDKLSALQSLSPKISDIENYNAHPYQNLPIIKKNSNGGGDSRNLEKILNLQFADVNGSNSGGFQKVFGTIVAELGVTVQSGQIALESAEASRNAAEEAEAELPH